MVSSYRLTREEKETVYRKSEVDKTWDAWTFSEATYRLWIRRGYDPVVDHQGGWSCKIRRITLGRPEKRKSTSIRPVSQFGKENTKSSSSN